MKASKISDAQKAFIIKRAEDGTLVAEICRKAGFKVRWTEKTLQLERIINNTICSK